MLSPTRREPPISTPVDDDVVWKQNVVQTEPVVDTVGDELLAPNLVPVLSRHPILARRCLLDALDGVAVLQGFLLRFACLPAGWASDEWIVASKNMRLDTGECIGAPFGVLVVGHATERTA